MTDISLLARDRVTGYGQSEDRARSAGAGFDAHLVKPLDASLLRAQLAATARRS